MLAALADGMGGGSHGREAAESTVRNLCADYYATPDTWDIPKALERVIVAANRWLHGQALSRREPGGMATTLSALALRGRRYVIAHVGDSRIYRLRGNELVLLTHDHVWDRPDMRHVLTRAVGLDAQIHRLRRRRAAPGRCLPARRDGAWEPLGQQRLHELLLTYGQHPTAARRSSGGPAHRGQDNATRWWRGIAARREPCRRPSGFDQFAGPRGSRRAPIDGLKVESILHDSRETLLARVRDEQGQPFVLKTLSRWPPTMRNSGAGWCGGMARPPGSVALLPASRRGRSGTFFTTSAHLARRRDLQQRLTPGAFLPMR
jgi:protein phosphatase